MLNLNSGDPELPFEQTAKEVDLENTSTNKSCGFTKCLVNCPLAHCFIYCISSQKDKQKIIHVASKTKNARTNAVLTTCVQTDDQVDYFCIQLKFRMNYSWVCLWVLWFSTVWIGINEEWKTSNNTLLHLKLNININRVSMNWLHTYCLAFSLSFQPMLFKLDVVKHFFQFWYLF